MATEPVMLELNPVPELETVSSNSTLHKQVGLRVAVGITCWLSLFGSLLIILSYLLFKDLRTRARLILVHLSIADFGVAFCNLFGEAYRFDHHFNKTATELSPLSVKRLCLAQAFVAHFSTISSVLWTMALAAFMYIVVTKLKNVVSDDKWFMRFSYLFCYGMSLLVCIWMVFTDKLGFSPLDTGGWCGTILHGLKSKGAQEPTVTERGYMTAVFGYDLWIVLTFIFIIVTYLSLHFYMREKRKKSADFGVIMHNIDYKFIIIPVAFVLLRMGSLVGNIIFVYVGMGEQKRDFPDIPHHIIGYVSGIGDSGQGAVNAVLFVIFTHSVRRRIISLCCYCCTVSKRSRNLVNAPGDESEASTDDSDSDLHTSPVKIARTPQLIRQNNGMGSMASTTSISPSPTKYHDSLSSYDS